MILGFKEIGLIALVKDQVSRNFICSQGVTKGLVTLAFKVSVTKNVICPLALGGFRIPEFWELYNLY